MVRRNCSLTRAEDQRLRREADKYGLRPTPLLKKAAFAYFERQYLVPQNTDELLRGLICLLRNMANNLNQIAVKANTLQKVSFHMIFRAERIVRELETGVKGFIHNPPYRDDR